MVNVGRRMNKLQVLLNLRHGAGAAILPENVTRIHLDFATRMNNGHMGPKKFWKSCLPRLKFWNPAIPMIVNRFKNTEEKAIMSIYTRKAGVPLPKVLPTLAAQPASNLADKHRAPAPAEYEEVSTIEMTNLHSDTILSELLAKTSATVVVPTPAEQREFEEIKDREDRAEIHRAIVAKYEADKKRESDMLAAARKEAEELKTANAV